MRTIILICTVMFLEAAYPEYLSSTPDNILMALIALYAGGYDLLEYLKK